MGKLFKIKHGFYHAQFNQNPSAIAPPSYSTDVVSHLLQGRNSDAVCWYCAKDNSDSRLFMTDLIRLRNTVVGISVKNDFSYSHVVVDGEDTHNCVDIMAYSGCLV